MTEYGLTYKIKSTYFTKAIILEKHFFKSNEERVQYLMNRKKKWWECLPFVDRTFWIKTF